MTGSRLNRLLQKIIKRTGNPEMRAKHITLHCLRHSIATHLLDAGETLEYVKTFLGHSLLDTSLIYAKRRQLNKIYQL